MKQPMELKKRIILQDVLLVLFLAAALFSALLTVLSLIPARAGLSVREEVTASAARVSMEEGAAWQVEARGRLRNTADHAITVERITVTVKGSPDVVLEVTEAFTLPPRADYDLLLSTTSSRAAEGVPEITAVVDGQSVFLLIPANTRLAATLLPLALAILFGILSWRAVRVRLYLQEERKG